MKGLDKTMASLFHMDWLVPMDATTEDDYTRAVAEKADVLLKSARFMTEQRPIGGTGRDVDLEVRVWVEAAVSNACVSITWEPGPQRFGFHLLDESLRERLACIVFHEVPSIDASQSFAESDAILDAAFHALHASRQAELARVADAVREAGRARRVPVEDVTARRRDE